MHESIRGGSLIWHGSRLPNMAGAATRVVRPSRGFLGLEEWERQAGPEPEPPFPNIAGREVERPDGKTMPVCGTFTAEEWALLTGRDEPTSPSMTT